MLWAGLRRPKTKRPIPEVLGIPFGSLLLPTIQLVFSNFYLGIAQGALGAATNYTSKGTRAWPYGGDNKDKAVNEWYILERYGQYRAHLAAADALADRAGAEIANLYRQANQYGSQVVPDASSLAKKVNPNYLAGSYSRNQGVGPNPPYNVSTVSHFQAPETDGHPNGHTNGVSATSRAAITAQHRGEVAATVAQVKVVTTDTGLTVTSGIFEMLGARATARKYGFDRYWRDIRTHTLHDPVAYKKREVGRYQVLGEIPEPTWYT